MDEVIFRNREIRQLQWLLSSYKFVVGDYGLAVGDVKSRHLKQLLIKEYSERIGFKEPRQKNQSEWVYDVTGGGSYIDAALYTTGIRDEQLMQNLCSRLHSKINETECVQWPPRIDQLEEEEDICCALVQFMSWLKQPPKKKHLDFSPKTLCLASIITQYVTGKRTTTAMNHGIDLHGHTRNKDLVDAFHKAGFIISYANILLLYGVWGLEHVSESNFIPREIAKDVSAICVVDNDDFKIDIVTGNSQQAH